MDPAAIWSGYRFCHSINDIFDHLGALAPATNSFRKTSDSEIQHHLIDHVLILSRALEPTAQVRVGDSFWLARTEDGLSLAEGTKVKSSQ